MKKSTRMSTIVIFFVILFFSIPVFAANTTEKANLKNLGIKPNDFSGFKENKTEYSTTVPNTTKEVEVYAKAKDSKAKITGTGKLKLEEGQNTAKVVVTAQNGTQKTYTINIKRLKSGEKYTPNSTSTASDTAELENLKIEGINLEPEFDKNTYQYKTYFQGDQNELNIEAETNGADVQIIGNTNLVDGENLITIIVSDKNEKNLSTYQIYANKNVTSPADSKYSEGEQKIWIIGFLVVGVLLIIIIIVIIKKSRNRKNIEYEEEIETEEDEEIIEYNKDEKNKKSGRHSK